MSNIDVGEVAMIPLNNITVGERARQEMGDLNEIEKSMKESGLISPLAVMAGLNGSYILLAGERRYRVLRKNEIEIVPVRIYPETITDLEIKVIELAENFYRKDFEYYEFDNLVRETHQLQQAIHGVKAPGPGSLGWSVENTGDMIGASKGGVSTAIKRANAREAFPELFNHCKTQKDASKLLDKMSEAVVKEALAKKMELGKMSGVVQQLSNSFIIGDFFEKVKEIPDGIMHLVEIDPPYGIDLINKKKSEGESQYVKEDYNEIDIFDYDNFLLKTFKECYRTMSEHSWLICWFGPDPWFEVIHNLLFEAGFKTTRLCGIWVKPSGQSRRPEMHLANSYEMFFYAWKGRPAMNKAGRSNVFQYSPVPPNQKTHPTERPVELMKDIYETFAFPGSRILIPFLGSGSGLIAADEVGMAGVGFELSKGYRDSFLVKIHNK